VTPLEIEHATYRLVAQCLNHLRHRALYRYDFKFTPKILLWAVRTALYLLSEALNSNFGPHNVYRDSYLL
jgi:hypothetical protein